MVDAGRQVALSKAGTQSQFLGLCPLRPLGTSRGADEIGSFAKQHDSYHRETLRLVVTQTVLQ